MRNIVPPFLDGIIQSIDETVCESYWEFTNIPFALRIQLALHIMQRASLANKQIGNNQDIMWKPTKKMLALFDYPPRELEVLPLIIKAMDDDELVADYIFRSAQNYMDAFVDAAEEDEICAGLLTELFHAYGKGLVDCRRGPEGKLEWILTKLGRLHALQMESSPSDCLPASAENLRN